jgi:transcriptional regulator with XRE-family HTH domain
MNELPAIGDVVREWRQYHQISLTEFSKQTNLSKGYISELEHKKIDNPKPEKLRRMAEALRLTERDIVSRRMPSENGEEVITPNEEQLLAGHLDPHASSASTVYDTLLPPSPYKTLMRMLAKARERLEAAEQQLEATQKNLRDAQKGLRHVGALAAKILRKE